MKRKYGRGFCEASAVFFCSAFSTLQRSDLGDHGVALPLLFASARDCPRLEGGKFLFIHHLYSAFRAAARDVEECDRQRRCRDRDEGMRISRRFYAS